MCCALVSVGVRVRRADHLLVASTQQFSSANVSPVLRLTERSRRPGVLAMPNPFRQTTPRRHLDWLSRCLKPEEPQLVPAHVDLAGVSRVVVPTCPARCRPVGASLAPKIQPTGIRASQPTQRSGHRDVLCAGIEDAGEHARSEVSLLSIMRGSPPSSLPVTERV